MHIYILVYYVGIYICVLYTVINISNGALEYPSILLCISLVILSKRIFYYVTKSSDLNLDHLFYVI